MRITLPNPNVLGRHQPRRGVVHAMGEFIDDPHDGPTPAWEFLRRKGLSAHAFVLSSGTVLDCVEPERIAQHAGGHNVGTLGIEFLVPGLHDLHSFYEAIRHPYYTPAQLEAGIEVVRGWASRYGWAPDDVMRHSDIDPERKRDPGDGFPWGVFLSRVFGHAPCL